MATQERKVTGSKESEGEFPVSSATEEMFLAALEGGGESIETGRYLITYRGRRG